MPVCGQNRCLGGGSSVRSRKESRAELLRNCKSQKMNKVAVENNFKTICLIFIKMSAAETNED